MRGISRNRSSKIDKLKEHFRKRFETCGLSGVRLTEEIRSKWVALDRFEL